MTRFFAAILTASLALGVSARAADLQVVVHVTDAKTTHAKIVEAAAKVCDTALAHDPSDEFGSRAECVDDAIRNAQRHRASDQMLASLRPQ